ncbi:hypothetical protein N185_32610 [Sinorhizobium sp. GW3]|nr:hypothetical protein N185_32610 [Sinorhizobium sp. GW3]
MHRQRHNGPGEIRECIAGERRATEGDFFAVPAGIVQTDLTGCVLPVNNRFCEILGYRESELLSMGMLDIGVARDIAEADRLFNNDG